MQTCINPNTYSHEEWSTAYFNLSHKCLRFHSNGIELRDIMMNNEALIQLTNDHIEYLAEEGFLPYIVANKLL